MTAAEFIQYVFGQLAVLDQIVAGLYVENDPNGVTFVSLAVEEVSAKTGKMTLNVTWGSSGTATLQGEGDLTWLQNQALSIVNSSPA